MKLKLPPGRASHRKHRIKIATTGRAARHLRLLHRHASGAHPQPGGAAAHTHRAVPPAGRHHGHQALHGAAGGAGRCVRGPGFVCYLGCMHVGYQALHGAAKGAGRCVRGPRC